MIENAFPGVKAQVNLRPWDLPGKPGRIATRTSILLCRECSLRESCKQPIPWGALGDGAINNPLDVVVIMDNPNTTTNTTGNPFKDRSVQYLYGLLRKAGVDLSRVAVVYVAACSTGARRVKIEEAKECHDNLMAQLQALAPTYALLVGATSLNMARPDMKLATASGRVFCWLDHLIVMPVYHPSAVMMDKGTAMAEVYRKDVEKFAKIVNQEAEIARTMVLERGCWWDDCNKPAEAYDQDGVGYCGNHYFKAGGRAGEARKRWDKWRRNRQRQRQRDTGGGLFNLGDY